MRKSRRNTSRNQSQLQALERLRSEYGAHAARRKKALLQELSPSLRFSPEHLQRYHNLLLFISAYPDNPAILRLATLRLGQCGKVAGKYPELQNSGILGTDIDCAFGLEATAWLFRTFPKEVELTWDGEGSTGRDLEDFWLEDVSRLDADAISSPTATAKGLLAATEKSRGVSVLFERLRRGASMGIVAERAFHSFKFEPLWHLGRPQASRSLARFPPRKLYMQEREPDRGVVLSGLMTQAPPRERKLSRVLRQNLLDTARVTLCARLRETDPVISGSPEGVRLFTLDHGIDVALFSSMPDGRRPLESYIGYVAARNGVPVAYGGAWILGHAAEIGVNIFEEFRGGESARIFGEIIRVYAQSLGVKRFLVDPYQFGAGNGEGLRSGAYWFYFRMGFRSVEERLRVLADAEQERMRAGPGHRTTLGVLRKFASAPVELVLDSKVPAKVDLALLATKLNKLLERKFKGDLIAGEETALRRLEALGVGKLMPRWTDGEQRAFRRLSILSAHLPGIKNWAVAERRSLGTLLREKGGITEYGFVQLVQQHPKFLASIQRLIGL